MKPEQRTLMNQTAYRINGIPLVKCPHCGRVNGFPKLDEVWVFACHYCGQAVGVVETITVRAA